MNESSREMTLKEWVGKLPQFHTAAKEYKNLQSKNELLKAENEKLKKQLNATTEQNYCTTCGRILSKGD